ncbi:N-acyl homoserine lactonase family protein [Sabulicella rubraurantiaca]|uniref:N-acyl homoserine lactonase family protein n=1 Tax=Sabulicella rubraurantiaca TaxID=2811429 RepID=UPI001A971FCD|nr:N-acyl homoserine lactonase family protein [Sabulicella rubraurantiaca]
MRLHLLEVGRLRMRRSTYIPDAPREETVEIPVPAYLVRHKGGNILIDTGCNPRLPDDPTGVWGGLSRVMTPLHDRETHIGTALAGLGLVPDDVDLVILSHLHVDHAGANSLFQRASFLLHEAELSAARAPDAEAKGYLRAEWEVDRPFTEVSGETHDVLGDERFVLHHFPGHTPGLMGALLRLERDGPVLLGTDAVPMMEVLRRDLVPRNNLDAEATRASLAKARALQAEGALLVCGHDPTQWPGLRHGAEGYA